MSTVREALLESLPPVTAFRTSGTTGEAQTWWRTRRQLVDEAELLVGLLGPRSVDSVLTHAPAEHLYGTLFGDLVPKLMGVPVRRLALAEPMPDDVSAPLVVAVPASWWSLERARIRLSNYRSPTVVHSTARLPGRARLLLDAVPGLVLHEVHGSTETGAVGHRRGGTGDWDVVTDVELATGQHAGEPGRRLAIVSSRVAVSSFTGTGEPAGSRRAHVLDDVVDVTGPRSYALRGRRTRLVKVNGRRIDLDDVEARLRDAAPGPELACALATDDLRGEWFEVLVRGTRDDVDRTADAARRCLRTWEQPRAVRAVSSFPDDLRSFSM